MEDKLKSAFHHAELTDDKSLAYICKALVRHNQPGFDYLEARLALVELGRLGMDPAMALQSALVSASALGVDKRQILDSVSLYRSILLKEREEFDKALANALHRKVESRLQESRQLEGRLRHIEEEIRRLEEEKVAIDQRLKEIQDSIASASGELERSEQAFRKTFEHVIAEMDRDKVRLEEGGI